MTPEHITDADVINWLKEPDTVLEMLYKEGQWKPIGWYAAHRNSPAMFAENKLDAIRAEIGMDRAIFKLDPSA